MTIGFLCSMLREDLPVFVEKQGNNTLYTQAGNLLGCQEVVGDFEFMKSDGLIIQSTGVIK